MASAAAETRAAESKTSYLLDKLHSLSGVIPIGAYLADHLWSNSYALVSVDKYNQVSSDLQTVPWRVLVEACVLWIPILFHGFYGLYIWWKGKQNTFAHPWMSNWMYLLQRWTGIIAFGFIGWHVYTERFLGHGVTTYSDVARVMSNPWYMTFYIVGVTSSAFHLGNGLWNFACKWGIAVSAPAQRAAAWFGAAVGVALTVAGVCVVLGFHYAWFPLGEYVK
jgi:succinate dehydrogenase / fumarate reductase, cytochrome b subunit